MPAFLGFYNGKGGPLRQRGQDRMCDTWPGSHISLHCCHRESVSSSCNASERQEDGNRHSDVRCVLRHMDTSIALPSVPGPLEPLPQHSIPGTMRLAHAREQGQQDGDRSGHTQHASHR